VSRWNVGYFWFKTDKRGGVQQADTVFLAQLSFGAIIKYVKDNGALVRKLRCIVLNKKKQKHLGMCLKVVKFAFKHKSNA